MCNCDQKIPTYSTETVKSKSCDRRDDILTACTPKQSRTGWPSGGSGDFPNGWTSRPAVNLYLRPPPPPSTIAHPPVNNRAQLSVHGEEGLFTDRFERERQSESGGRG